MVFRFCVRPTSKRWFLKIVQVTMNTIQSMSCRNLCRLYTHLAFTYILRWSLKQSVKRTWTSSAFSTHESAWSVMVTGSQSRVWSGPWFQVIGGQFMQSQPLRAWKLGLITSHGSQVTRGQSVQSQLLRAWKLGLTTSSWSKVLGPKYDMATLFEGEVRFGTCVESWVEQKTRPNSHDKVLRAFVLKII
jgi:hypothetical protein